MGLSQTLTDNSLLGYSSFKATSNSARTVAHDTTIANSNDLIALMSPSTTTTKNVSTDTQANKNQISLITDL
jgi:hypothetical protein